MPSRVVHSDRRRFLAGSGAMAATSAALLSGAAVAKASAGLGTPDFARTGNFDLSDPADRLFARVKMVTSLTGEHTFTYSVARHMLAPPNQPSYELYAELDLRMFRIEPAAGEGGLPRSRAVFTKIPVDPRTFEPISEYYNPYLGRTVAVGPNNFEGPGSPLHPDGAIRSSSYQQDSAHYRMGNDIVFVFFDPRNAEGTFQPHTDSAMMRADYAALMDPQRGWVEADYTISAVRKASVYPWSGIEKGDQAQVLSMKLGRKVGSVEQLPPEFQRTIVKQFPERVGLGSDRL